MVEFDAAIGAIGEQPLLSRIVYRDLPSVKTAVFLHHL